MRNRGSTTRFNLLATTALVVAVPLATPEFAQAQVVGDGRTATSIARNGATTNVRTGTISGNHGVNSFSQFNVRSGSTVNLHAPTGTRGTVNIVNGSQAQIHGMVRGMQNGAVGGDVYIAAPNGVVVGPAGSIRAGSIGLSTPSQSVVNNLFGPGGSVNGQGIGQIVGGTAPLGPGSVSVHGSLTADERIRLRAGGQVTVDGAVTAGSDTSYGTVDIYGQNGVTFTGNASVTARNGNSGGTVRVRSAQDVTLQRGARILSDATGSGDAGIVDIYADGSAFLNEGAVISAAAYGSGTGGFVEFSATNVVEALGDLEAFSEAGDPGLIYIDPADIIISDETTSGTTFVMEATNSITVLAGSTINTVASNGSAGDVHLLAPNITLEPGVEIIATNGVDPGARIHLEARLDDRDIEQGGSSGGTNQNWSPIGSTRITITDSVLRGDTVEITATTYKDNTVDLESASDSYLTDLAGPLNDFEAVRTAIDLANGIASDAQRFLEKIDIENLPMFLDAHATIQMDGSYVQADTDAVVKAEATTHFEIAPENRSTAFAIAASNTVARTMLHNTAIDAGTSIEVKSVANEEQTLIAKSGVQDPDVDPTAFNLAVAASLRRSRSETIVNGVRPVLGFDRYASTDPDTSNYIPWNPNVGQGEYAILTTGGTIDVASLTMRDIMMTSDAVTSDEATGFALAISLESSKTETYLGGAIAAQSGQIDIRAETIVDRFASRARVSGGTEAVENVDPDPDNQEVNPEDQESLSPDVTDLILGTFTVADAVTAVLDSKMGDGTGGSGDDETNRIALAGSVIVHDTKSIAEVGGDHEYEAPDGTVVGLIAPLLETTPDGSYGRPGGQFWADGTKIDLDAEPKLTIAARNTLKDIRVETLTQVGSVPLPEPDPDETDPPEGELTGDTAEELQTSGENVVLVSVGVSRWNLGADVLLDDDSENGYGADTRMPSDAGLIAENVFAETEGRDTVGDWWGEYRTALEQTESDNPADLPEDAPDTGADPDPDAGGGGLPGGGQNRPGRGGKIGGVADGDAATVTGLKPDDPDAPAPDPDDDPDAPEDADDPVAQTPTDTRMFVAESTGRGSEVGAGINVLFTDFNLEANAEIGDAWVDRETYFRSSDAGSEDEDASAFLIARNAGDIIASAGLSGTSTGGEKGGYGGALSILTVNSTARTEIDSDATITLENLEQRTEQDLLIVNTARAHAQNDDGGTGLNIAVAITDYTAVTESINAGDNEGRGTEGIAIRADDKTSVVTLAGSGSLDADKGFAIGVAVNLTDRQTTTTFTGDINVDADIEIGASTTGSILAAGTASARDSLPDEDAEEAPDDPDTPEDESDPEIPDEKDDAPPVELSSDLFGDKADDVAAAMGNGDDGSVPAPDPGGSGDSGGDESKTFAFAGDFAATFGTVATNVLLDGADVATEFEKKIEITATTEVEYGQASSVTASAVDGVGISGSFGLSLIDHDTNIRVLDSAVYVYEDDADQGEGATRIRATDSSVFDTLVTGRAAHSEDAWGVAVSASFNQFKSAASVEVDNSTITNGRVTGFGGEGGGEGEGEYYEGEGEYYEGEDPGGEGDGGFSCIDGVCSDNAVGRLVEVHAEALPVSTVTVFAARDAVGAESSGDNQMDKMAEQMEDAANQAEQPDNDELQTPETDPAPDPDPGDGTPPDPDEDRGKGRKGVSISIAPSVVHADAKVTIVDTLIIADRDRAQQESKGKIDILSSAVTTTRVDATAGTIGLSFALTKTNSQALIENSNFHATGNGSVAVRSNVGEVQEVAARVASDSRVKVAGILSLRESVNRVIIDGGANTGTIISGGMDVVVSATTTRSLDFTAHASDSTKLVFAGSGIVSLGDADTATYVGGSLASAGTVGVSASDTTTHYAAEAIVTTGSLTDEELDESIEADGGGDKPKTPFGKRDKAETPGEEGGTAEDSSALAGAMANIADNTTEKASETAEERAAGDDGTGDPGDDDKEDKAKKSLSFAIAVNADRTDTTVTALIGGSVSDIPTGRDLDLTEGAISAGTASITAVSDIQHYQKVTAAKAGSLDDVFSFVGTFSYGFMQQDVTARVDQTASAIAAGSLTVSARNALPTNSIAGLQNPLNDTTLALKTIEDEESLLADDLLPDPALGIDQEDWNVLNRTEGQAGVGFVVDLGIHTAKLETTAEIADGVRVPVGASVTVKAENEGGLIALRDIPVEESVSPEKREENEAAKPDLGGLVDGLTDDNPGDDLNEKDRQDARDEEERTRGTVGIGGAVQYLRLDANATAEVDTLTNTGSLFPMGSLTVSAENDMQGVVVAKSFGAADTVAFNGGFGIIDYRGDARALLSDEASLSVNGGTTIRAEDAARLFAFGGAGSQSGKVAIGLGAGLIFADRSAIGAVTSADPTKLVDTRQASIGTDLYLGDLSITTETGGWSVAGASAGAEGIEDEDAQEPEPDDPDTPEDESETPKKRGEINLPGGLTEEREEENEEGLGEQTTSDETGQGDVADKAFGFALAADFAGVFGTNTALSTIAVDSDVELDSLTLDATNSADAVLATGAMIGTGGNIGLAGAMSISDVKTEVHAITLGGTRVLNVGDITISALDDGDLLGAAAGRGGVANTFSLVGSGTLHLGRSVVGAQIYDSGIEAAGDVSIEAKLEGATVAVAGSLAREAAEEAREEQLGDDNDETAQDYIEDVNPFGEDEPLADDTDGGDAGEGGDQQDEGESTSIAVGLTYAQNSRVETVLAEVYSSDLAGDSLDISAENSRTITGIAAATGDDPDFGISVSAVVTVLTQDTTARVFGTAPVTLDIADDATIAATNSAHARNQVGFSGAGSRFGLGITGAALVDRRDTLATLRNVDATGDDIAVDAVHTGISEISLSSGLASNNAGDEDGGYAVNIPVTILTTQWETRATVETSDIAATGTLSVEVDEDAEVKNRQGAVTQAGEFSSSVGVAITTYNADAIASVTGSDLTLGRLSMEATTSTLLRSVALRDGESAYGFDVITAILRGRGETAAILGSTDTIAGRVDLTATDATRHDVFANGYAENSSGGASGGIGLNLYKRDLTARIKGGSVTTTQAGIDMLAVSQIKATNVVLGHNGGASQLFGSEENVTGLANVAWTTDARDVIAEIDQTTLDTAGSIDLAARREDTFLAVQAGTNRSSKGVGLGAGIFKFHGLTTARIVGERALTAGGDVNLVARNETEVLQVAIGVTVGGGFAAVGSMGYVDFGQRSNDLGQVDGDPRGVLLRDVVEDVLNEGAGFIEEHTDLDIAEFDLTRESLIEARLDIDGAPVDIGANLELVAIDAREADAISGQLTATLDISLADFLLDMWTVERDDDTGKFRVARRPEAPESEASGNDEQDEKEVDPGEDSEGAESFDQADSANADGQQNDGGDDGGSGDENTPINFGIGVSWVRVGGEVSAILDLANAGETIVGQDTTLSARSETAAMTASAGAAFLDNALGAGGAVTRQVQLVRSRIAGDGTLTTGALIGEAVSDNKLWSMAGVLSIGEDIGFGGTLALNEMLARTQVRVTDDAGIRTSFGDVRLSARDDTRGVAMGVAGVGSANSTGISAANGVILSRSAVDAIIDGGAVIDSYKGVSAEAVRSQELAGLAYQVVIASSVGAGGALGLAVDKGITTALIEDADITASDNVALRARNNTKVVSSGMGGGYGGSAGVTGSVSITVKNDTVTSLVSDSYIRGGDVLVEALNGGRIDSIGGADETFFGSFDQATLNLTFGNSAAIGVSVAVIDSAANVRAAIDDDSEVIATRTAGFGVEGVRRRENSETWMERESEFYHGVAVVADNATEFNTLAMTGTASAGFSLSAQVPVLIVKDSVIAEIMDGADVTSATDVDVFAGNASRLRSTTVTGSFGTTAGVGAHNEFFRIEKHTEAAISNATVEADRDIRVEAVTPEDITSIALSGAVGIYAGIAGVNQVGITRSRTAAYVFDSEVTGRDMSIIATAPRQLKQTAGTAGGGFVGVGASVVILDSRDEVLAETTSGTASGGFSTLTIGGDLEVHADARMIPAGRVPVVDGQNGEGSYSVNQAVIGNAGGLIGIAGAGLYTNARQSVTARIGDYTRFEGLDLHDVTVTANQTYGQDVFVLTASGGAVGAGAAGVITSMRNAVLAEIGRGVTLNAEGDVLVQAYGERNFTGAVVAGGGGALSFQGSGILLTYGKRIKVDDDDYDAPDWQAGIDDADENLQDDTFTNSDDPVEAGEEAPEETYDMAQGANPDGPQDGQENILANMLGKVTAGRREINLDASFNGADLDEIRTEIGADVTINAANVDIGAREGGELDLLAGGASGGAISATHGVALVRRGTTVETVIGSGTTIAGESGGTVRIGAVADVEDGTPQSIAGSGGAIASSMGIVDMRVGRAVRVSVAADTLIAGENLIVEAEETGETEALVRAGVGGAIGVGVAIAGAVRDSSIQVLLANGSRPTELRGKTLTVEARRYGKTEATVNLVASGAIGVGGASAIAKDTSVVTVDLGGANLSADEVIVRSINAGDVNAQSYGLVGGAGTTGLHNAVAQRLSATNLVGNGIDLSAGDATFLAVDNIPGAENVTVYAEAISTTISGGSLNGSNTLARNESAVETRLRFGSFDVSRDAWLGARNEADLEYLAKGVTASLVGLGASLARGIDRSSAILDVDFLDEATVGGTFTARSGGDGYLFGNAVSGRGGIVSVFASENRLTMDVNTDLDLDGAMLTATRVDVATNRLVTFESNSDSIEVALAGYGATRQINQVDSDNRLGIGLDLTAEEIEITSQNDFTKRSIDFNGVSGSFGGINRAALVSRTEVESDATIDLDPGVLITQVPTTADPRQDTGHVTVAVRTTYDLSDRLTGDMGGAVPLPKLSSKVIVGDENDDEVWSSGTINMSNARILANGDVTLASRADAAMNAEAYVRTYGFAGLGEATAHTILRHVGDIDLASGEIESRRGSVSILVGADESGVQEQVQHAEARVHNRTAVPLNSDPDAVAEIHNRGFIDVGGAMDIRAARDVNLETGTGFNDAYAYGYAIDAYSEGAEAVVNFFNNLVNAEEVSYARESGESSVSRNTGVIVDGSVEAGAFAAQRLFIDFASSAPHPVVNNAGDLVITTEGDFDYELEFDRNISQKIEDFIEELTDLRDEYDAGSSVYETLTTQIEALEARLDFLDANGIGSLSTDFVNIRDVTSSGGNVNVSGEYFIGTGAVTANGDALIEVINNSSVSLDVAGLVIPFEDAGEVRYNGVSADTTNELTALGAGLVIPGATTPVTPLFDLTANHTDATPPNIVLRNNYVSSNNGPTSDIYVRGDVENLNGNVEMRTEDGSIYVFGGDINALSVTIDSGGDFFLAPSDPVTHLTQDPRGQYENLFDAMELYWNRVYAHMNANPDKTVSQARSYVDYWHTPEPNEVLPDVAAQGSVTAVGNIFIYADTLNINGLIQSGVTDWDLTIDAAIDTFIDNQNYTSIENLYRPLRGDPVGSDPDSTNVELIGNNPTSGQPGDPYISGNISISYNPFTDALEIAPIRVKGGYIEIAGKIVSTGNGRIEAANGYGDVYIDSDSSRDLHFSHVDMGPEEGVEGTIRIIDKNQVLNSNVLIIGQQPEYLTTTYKQYGEDQVRVSSNASQFFLIEDEASFAPVDDMALYFTTAADREVRQTRSESVTEFTCLAVFGCGSREDEVADPVFQGDPSPVFLANKPDVGYIGIADDNLDALDADGDFRHAYEFTPLRRQLDWQEVVTNVETETFNIGIYREDTTTTDYEVTFTERRIFTHRLKADHEIDIDFHGRNANGSVQIEAGGSVLFNENVRSPNGRVNVDAAGDILTVGPETSLSGGSARLRADGDIGGTSASGFSPREYRIIGDIEARDIFGRRTGADLGAGAAAYRNELLGAATSQSAPQVALLNGDRVNLDVIAGGSIRLRNATGDYRIAEVTSGSLGDVQVEAEGDIEVDTFGNSTIRGGDVSLLSETGSIGVRTDRGYGMNTMDVTSIGDLYVQAYGYIDLVSPTHAFDVTNVTSTTGDVRLEATAYSVRDADDRETADRRAEAELLGALWDELRLIDNESLRTPTKAEVEKVIGDIVDEKTAEYFDWWSWLVVYNEEGKVERVLDYDDDIVLELSEREKLEFKAKGLDEDEITQIVQDRTDAFHALAGSFGNEFDAEYRYDATEAERDAVRADLQQQKLDANPIVQREIANRTAEYQEWWSRLEKTDPDDPDARGFLEYDEDFQAYDYSGERRAGMLASGLTDAEIDALEAQQNDWFHQVAERYAGKPYDESYTYEMSADEVKELIDSAFFTTTELEAAFRRDLILPVLDTQLTIEEPNVVGRDVTLIAGLDIGETSTPTYIPAGTTITKEQRLALFSAARADIEITPTQIVIHNNDDIDIEATGQVSVFAGRNAYVGSETDVLVEDFDAMGDARLFTAGTIASNGGRGVLGESIVLEASGGGIGSQGTPLLMDIRNNGSVAARAAGEIHLFAPSSDIRIEEIYSPERVFLEAKSGSIRDADPSSQIDMLSRGFWLKALGNIGVDAELTQPGARVFAESREDLGLNVFGGEIALERVASTNGTVEFWNWNGGATVVHPTSASSAEGMAAFHGKDGIQAWINGDITETSGLWSTFNTDGTVDLTAWGNAGSETQGLTIDADTLALRVMPGAGALNAWFNGTGDLTLSKLLAGTGDVTVTTTGHLINDLDAGDFASLTLRTLGEPGEASDIVLLRDFSTTAEQSFTAEAARNLNLGGASREFLGTTRLVAGLRGSGSVAGSTSSVIEGGNNSITVEAADNVRLFGVDMGGHLDVTTVNGGVLLADAEVGSLTVKTGSTGNLAGQVESRLVDLDVGTIADGSVFTLGGNTAQLSLRTEGYARITPLGPISLNIADMETGAGPVFIAGTDANISLTGAATSLGDLYIGANNIFVDKPVTGLADGSSSLGQISFVAGNDLTISGAAGIHADAGPIELEAGGTMRFANLSTQANRNRAISLTADSIIQIGGTVSARNGQLLIDARTVGTSGGPLRFGAETVHATFGDGPAYLRSVGPLELEYLGGTQGHYDVISENGIYIAGRVDVDDDAVVILTATQGDITTDVRAPAELSGNMFLTAWTGGIRARQDDTPLTFNPTSDLSILNAAALGDIDIFAMDNLRMGYAVSHNGNVDIAVDGQLDLALAGTPGDFTLDVGSLRNVPQHGRNDPLDTTPISAELVADAANYPVFAVVGPDDGDTGGGDTGGGDTGGGDTGGGDTGGGDTGGGDTGGGDTGGGDTGGGDTDGGDNGSSGNGDGGTRGASGPKGPASGPGRTPPLFLLSSNPFGPVQQGQRPPGGSGSTQVPGGDEDDEEEEDGDDT